jgi:hypothetical protein
MGGTAQIAPAEEEVAAVTAAAAEVEAQTGKADLQNTVDQTVRVMAVAAARDHPTFATEPRKC